MTQTLYCLEFISRNPHTATHTGLHSIGFWLFPFRSPLLRESHIVFSSWRYLDVSVHAVRFLTLYIQIRILGLRPRGLPHSEIPGSMLDWQLPEAYSSLPLPSSPTDAKAFTKCPFQLPTNSHTKNSSFTSWWIYQVDSTEFVVVFFRLYISKIVTFSIKNCFLSLELLYEALVTSETLLKKKASECRKFYVHCIKTYIGLKSPSKGGDPAAGSPTATLLRLYPNHHPHLHYPPPLTVS